VSCGGIRKYYQKGWDKYGGILLNVALFSWEIILEAGGLSGRI
jgi:hypothetical protein